MKTLVIYDSVFGNTEKVAQEIANSLSSSREVTILRVGSVKPDNLSGIDFLIVGSPTRAFRPTQEMTKFLDNLPRNSLRNIKIASFDTRIDPNDVKSPILTVSAKLFGYAAKPIAEKLVKKGGVLVCPPEGFFVNASEGPLRDGELARAAEWAKQVK